MRAAWGAALLCGVALIAYLPALRGGFVWDDDSMLTQNPLIKAADGLYRFWFTTEPADYWPVTATSLWVEWRLWGMNAFGYHAVNLGLHLAEALLLWAILRRLRIPGAYLAALLFAVHPVNAESVAWIAQRKNLMAMLFFLLAIFWFIPAELEAEPRGAAARAYALSLLAFTLAMLSKGSVAILPVVLLGLVAWRRRLAARDVFRSLPFFLVAGALTLVNVWFQRHNLTEPIRSAGFLERLLGAGAAVWFYLYKAVLPVGLVFVYPEWRIQAGNPLWWAPLLAAAGLTAALWRYRARGSRPALFAWGYFCVALVPVMGFTDVYFMKYSLVADHYQHLALIGVVVLAAAAWGRRFEGAQGALRAGMGAAAAILIAVLAGLTWRQCLMYRDTRTLFETTLQGNPGCWMAHDNLGMALSNSGETEAALAHFGEAVRIKPESAMVRDTFGNALSDAGRTAEAIEQYGEALRLKPNFPEARFNLANALGKAGRTAEAIEQYREALRLKPNFPEARDNLASTLSDAGKIDEAIEQYEIALRLNPDFAAAHVNLGNALNKAGRLAEAISHYERAIRIDPDFADAHYDLGNTLVMSGRPSEAIEQYRQTLRIRPDLAQAHHNLGIALRAVGRTEEADAELEEAARLKRAAGDAR